MLLPRWLRRCTDGLDRFRLSVRPSRETGARARRLGLEPLEDRHVPGVLNPGDIFIADLNAFGTQGGVIQVDPVTGAQTTITSGGNLRPFAIAVTADEIFVTSAPSDTIFRIDAVTGARTTIASGGMLVAARSIAVAANGDLLIADEDASVGAAGGVIRVNPTTGAQTAVSLGGLFRDPRGIAVAANGDIFVTDTTIGGAGGVIRVDPITGAQTLVSSEGFFADPEGIAVAADGTLLIADQSAYNEAGQINRAGVIRVDPLTGAQTLVSSGGLFTDPIGIAIAADGTLLIADQHAFSGFVGGIIRVDPATGAQATLSSGGQFADPWAIAIVPTPPNSPPVANDDVLIATTRVVSVPVLANDVDPDGDPLGVIGVTQGQFGAVTVNGDGTLSYTLTRFFRGTDTFNYTVADGRGGTATATVTIDVRVPAANGIAMIRSQVSGLDLPIARKKVLDFQLRLAARMIALDRPQAAVLPMRVFIYQISQLERSGRLDSAVADVLIGEARAVIALLS